MSFYNISCTRDFEFLGKFPCTGDFEFLRHFPGTGDFEFERKIPPVLETLSLNEKIPVPGFFPVLETLSLSEKISRYWGAMGAKKNVGIKKLRKNFNEK